MPSCGQLSILFCSSLWLRRTQSLSKPMFILLGLHPSFRLALVFFSTRQRQILFFCRRRRAAALGVRRTDVFQWRTSTNEKKFFSHHRSSPFGMSHTELVRTTCEVYFGALTYHPRGFGLCFLLSSARIINMNPIHPSRRKPTKLTHHHFQIRTRYRSSWPEELKTGKTLPYKNFRQSCVKGMWL